MVSRREQWQAVRWPLSGRFQSAAAVLGGALWRPQTGGSTQLGSGRAPSRLADPARCAGFGGAQPPPPPKHDLRDTAPRRPRPPRVNSRSWVRRPPHMLSRAAAAAPYQCP